MNVRKLSLGLCSLLVVLAGARATAAYPCMNSIVYTAVCKQASVGFVRGDIYEARQNPRSKKACDRLGQRTTDGQITEIKTASGVSVFTSSSLTESFSIAPFETVMKLGFGASSNVGPAYFELPLKAGKNLPVVDAWITIAGKREVVSGLSCEVISEF